MHQSGSPWRLQGMHIPNRSLINRSKHHTCQRKNVRLTPFFFTKCLYYLQHLFKRRLFILNYKILVETILCIETLDIKHPIFGKFYASGLKRKLSFFGTFMSHRIPIHWKNNNAASDNALKSLLMYKSTSSSISIQLSFNSSRLCI